VKPYYDDGQITLYCGDSLAVMADLPTATVDGVLVDAPYSSGGMFRSDRQGKTTDKYRGFSHAPGATFTPKAERPEFGGDSRDQRAYGSWCALWMGECLRLARPGSALLAFSDWRQIPTTSDAIQAGGWVWRGMVVWDKGIGRPMKGRFRNHVEYVLWGSDGPMDGDNNPVYLDSVYRVPPPAADARHHLTEKPVVLLKHLCRLIRPGGVVLDPFVGSGSTLVAARAMGLRAIGIEIEEPYCEIAVRRLAQLAFDLEAAG
jgi:site-specific DNA-methyltransferase (adenine-specific)